MKFIGTLISVTDRERSICFYREVLGLEVIQDFGANVMLSGGLFLQTADTWITFIHKESGEVRFGHNAGELYFEEDEIDAFLEMLAGRQDIKYLHPPLTHAWGQRVVRFYDPDKHIIEVGENVASVVKRFLNSGLSEEETALRMDVSVEYVRSLLT